MALIFHFKYTLKCRLQFGSIWISLKFCRLVMGLFALTLSFVPDRDRSGPSEENKALSPEKLRMFCLFNELKYQSSSLIFLRHLFFNVIVHQNNPSVHSLILFLR